MPRDDRRQPRPRSIRSSCVETLVLSPTVCTPWSSHKAHKGRAIGRGSRERWTLVDFTEATNTRHKSKAWNQNTPWGRGVSTLEHRGCPMTGSLRRGRGTVTGMGARHETRYPKVDARTEGRHHDWETIDSDGSPSRYSSKLLFLRGGQHVASEHVPSATSPRRLREPCFNRSRRSIKP